MRLSILSRAPAAAPTSNHRPSSSDSSASLAAYFDLMAQQDHDALARAQQSSPPSSRGRRTPRRKRSSRYDTNDLAEILRQSNEDILETVALFHAATRDNPSEKNPPPASEEALARLPHARVLPMNREEFKHDTTECSICCNRLIDGVALVRLPCGHLLHINCAVTWLTKKCTCPECRYEVPTNYEHYEIGRVERMSKRKTVTCSCHPSGMHSCFFNDPTKSLCDQLSGEAFCPEVSSDEGDSCSEASSCEAIDHGDLQKMFL